MNGTAPVGAAQAESSASTIASPFLSVNSTMQSYLRNIGVGYGPAEPHFRKQQARCLGFYGALVAVCTLLSLGGGLTQSAKAFLFGAMLPGAGFLQWTADGQVLWAVSCTAFGLALFGAGLVLWFASGNLLAPIMIWFALALAAGHPESFGLNPAHVAGEWPLVISPVLWFTVGTLWLLTKPKPPAAAAHLLWVAPEPKPEAPPEMSMDDLQRLRLLLDRALQPASEFNGFERRDQFQTAAMRYQVNFSAYALVMAHQRFAPSAEAYFSQAQQRLQEKIGDSRMWRYWQLENAWGRLRLGADPVPDQNIMFSGFTALQMGLAGTEELVLHRQGRAWQHYSLDEIAALLEQQYQASYYGLLACEPNWIYPLCNLITATGIKAADARNGTSRWAEMSGQFQDSLAREGMRSDGSFIAFRSALTGLAPPAPGGIVMQAFPCFFLNSLNSTLARQHWHRVRSKLTSGSWQRLFWPIDVGNYGFSRASGYAATAAAACEMGDREILQECLQRLDAECPSVTEGGVTHRAGASLWAHALELTARCGAHDALKGLTEASPSASGPMLIKAEYPDVLIARAHSENGVLELVLCPGATGGTFPIELAGLMSGRRYRAGLQIQSDFCADRQGRAVLEIALHGRTAITISPVV